MYAQCDHDGNTYVLFDYITNFRQSTNAFCYADQTARKEDGGTSLRRSTSGWQLCFPWKDGSNSRGKLSDLKELHPLETSEDWVSQSLEREPVFNWWVPFVMEKRACIISLVKQRSARYTKCNDKCME